MRSLRELQREFSTSVLKGEDHAPEGLASPRTGGRASRFDIYGDGYRLRLIESLATDYPATRAVLGADRFAELARGFVEAHTSPYFNLRWYGAEFADFLRATGHGNNTYASAMAAFEWALAGAFDAADASPISADEMSRIPPDAWPVLHFDFHPSLRRLTLPGSVPERWKAALTGNPGSEATTPQDSAVWIVWRRDLAVVYRRADHDEADALERAADGKEFAEVCAGLSTQVGETATAARAAFLLRRWVAEGLITGLGPEAA